MLELESPGLSLTLATAPAEEPVSLEEMKLHLKVDSDLTEDDDLISALITAARELAESEQRRALVTQTWDLSLDDFPCWPAADVYLSRKAPALIRIPKPPLQSIVSLAYVDADGDDRTLAEDTDFLVVAGDGGLVYPVPGTYWPATQCGRLAAVTIRFVAGYGAASAVPKSTKAAIKMMVADWYCGREGRGELGVTVKWLLAAEKWGYLP